MDSIHVYPMLGGYFDELDFIRHAKKRDLVNIPNVKKAWIEQLMKLPDRKNLYLTTLPESAHKIYDLIKGYDITSKGFANTEDFIKRASLEQIKETGLGKIKAKRIFDKQSDPNLLNMPIVNELGKIIEGYKNKNYFTLDHYIPQSACCLFARSLYNFVPSCYVCNSKLKGEELLNDQNRDLHTCSPTYKEYDLTGNLEFSLVQKSAADIFDYSKKDKRKQFLENFEIEIESSNVNSRIVSVLNLRQRYSLYKDKAVYLAYLKEKYSEQSLKEIAKILSQGEKKHITANDIRNDIFNDPLDRNESFSKLHRDIKKQVGIKVDKE